MWSVIQRNTIPYRLTSGLVDGIFDLNVGGTEALGLVGQAQSAEGLGGILASRWGGTAVHTIGDAVGGAGVTEPSEIDRIFTQYPACAVPSAISPARMPEELAATPAYQPVPPNLRSARSGDDGRRSRPGLQGSAADARAWLH